MKKLTYTSGLVTAGLAAAIFVGTCLAPSLAFAQSTKGPTPPTLSQTQKPDAKFSFPDGTPVEQVYAKCRDMVIVKVDNRVVCEPKILDSFDKIVEDMRHSNLARNPVQAGSEGDRTALRHLPDVSPDAARKARSETQNLMDRYQALDSQTLRGENLLNYKLLGFVLSQKLLLADYDEARIPFTNDSGFFNMMSYVSRQTKFDSIDDYEAYAQRLSEMPRFFNQHMDNMRRGIKTNYTASDQVLPGVIDMVGALADGEASEHSYYQPFTAMPDIIPKPEQERLKTLGLAVMTDKVLPAHKDLLKFLKDEYAPHARKVVGIGTNPQNRTYYKALVKYFTTLDITPDAVHELGLSEVKRIRAQMDAIILETGFKGTFKEFLEFLRTDPQFYATSEEQLLKEASWIAKRIDGQMPKFFGTLPRLSYGVIPVPKEIAPNYTTGRYWGGNPSQGIAGNFVLNTYNLPQRPLYNLPALTLHEGVPGHHHQISLGQELKNVPEFRQNLYPNAFGEGWGLYAEKLGVEMGIYKTPYEQFGRLTYEMWRACRLVVDTGMHWKGWTRQQAEACFLENSALSPHNIHTEVERYISWPGQALAYKIGELKILELRKRAEDKLGVDFDIREFHDTVLTAGGIPLPILEERVDAWIAKKSAED